jgi:hypothetical protein
MHQMRHRDTIRDMHLEKEEGIELEFYMRRV